MSADAKPLAIKEIPLSEVAKHCTESDCWVAIHGNVRFRCWLPRVLMRSGSTTPGMCDVSYLTLIRRCTTSRSSCTTTLADQKQLSRLRAANARSSELWRS